MYVYRKLVPNNEINVAIYISKSDVLEAHNSGYIVIKTENDIDIATYLPNEDLPEDY
jgi:hypothetical protein